MRNRCLEQDKLHIDKSFKFPSGEEKCKLWDFSICSLEQNLVQQLALSERKPIFDIIWQYLTAANFSGLHQCNGFADAWIHNRFFIVTFKSATLTTSIVLRLVPTQSYPAYRASASMLPFLFLLFTLFRLTSMPLLYTLSMNLTIHLHAYHLSPFRLFCQVIITTCSGDALCCLVCPGYSKAYSPFIHLSS